MTAEDDLRALASAMALEMNTDECLAVLTVTQQEARAAALEEAMDKAVEAFGKVTKNDYVMSGPRAYMIAMKDAIRSLIPAAPGGSK